MTLTEKSRNTLEWPRVLERLSSLAVSDEAKERCLALAPTGRLAEAREWQAQTTAALQMMEARGSPGFSGLRPVAPALSRTQLGGVLNARELLDIAAVLRVARRMKKYAAGEGKSPAAAAAPSFAKEGQADVETNPLNGFFRLITGNKHLEDQITGSIISETEIADHASPELASIRRHMRIKAARVRELLQKYISSPSTAKFLQDSLVTQRSGRSVIPVKAEHKGDIPGLVHDVSGSGSTLFIEPMPVVQAGNELRELESKEQKEIDRILAELSLRCDEYREDILMDYDTLCVLDIIFARAKLSGELRCTPPELNDRGQVDFREARHPLLPADSAVPISVWLGGEFDTLVITGPNTGGKTVTLKTLGLLTLMASSGLHIPAGQGSIAAVTDRVYADIGDEQSIAQSLSTFSSHMTNIVGILAELAPGGLVLFDELGAGTDPTEGAALAVAIIEESRRRGALIAATTHYAELKMYALTAEKVENASCEFDVETLRPTYRLLIGVPGKSNAFAISRRLGLPENIIESAGRQVGVRDKAFEEVLTRLERDRQTMEQHRSAAEADRRQSEEDLRKAAETRRRIEQAHENAAERARADARRIIEEARREADEIMRELSRMKTEGASNEAMTAVRQKLNQAENRLFDEDDEIPPEEEQGVQGPIRAGDEVLLASTGTKATVLEPPDKNDMLVVQAGIMKVTVPRAELRPCGRQSGGQRESKKPAVGGVSVSRSAEPQKMELDLRGQMTEEGVMAMEQFIDNAVMSKIPAVTVIHGKGTGALRAAVQIALRRNKAVKSFRAGRYGEGEAGVTVVELK